jgi:hypothetical protein
MYKEEGWAAYDAQRRAAELERQYHERQMRMDWDAAAMFRQAQREPTVEERLAKVMEAKGITAEELLQALEDM